MNIYPNPVKHILTVEVDFLDLYQIKVFNNLGQEMSLNNYKEGTKLLINTNNLVQGIYFIEVSKEGVKKVVKFIRK